MYIRFFVTATEASHSNILNAHAHPLSACQALDDDRRSCAYSSEQSRIKSYRLKGSVMRSTQQFSITLPNQMADLVKAKVAAGEYATESEVIRDGLRALLARDRALENWLIGQVAPAYDALKADPSRALSADDVRSRLAAEHQNLTAES